MGKGGERERERVMMSFKINVFTHVHDFMYLNSECRRSWGWECHTVGVELLHSNNVTAGQSHHAMEGYHPECALL